MIYRGKLFAHLGGRKYVQLEVDSDAVDTALAAAVAALYVREPDAHEKALWIIAERLGGQRCIALLATDRHEAYRRYAVQGAGAANVCERIFHDLINELKEEQGR